MQSENPTLEQIDNVFQKLKVLMLTPTKPKRTIQGNKLLFVMNNPRHINIYHDKTDALLVHLAKKSGYAPLTFYTPEEHNKEMWELVEKEIEELYEKDHLQKVKEAVEDLFGREN